MHRERVLVVLDRLEPDYIPIDMDGVSGHRCRWRLCSNCPIGR